MALEFNESNFENEVLKSDKPVVVDFWAEWCGPCRNIAPIFDELHTQYADKAKVGKVNVDESPAIAAKYGIRNIPTVLYFKNGELADKQVGAVNKKTFEDKLKALF